MAENRRALVVIFLVVFVDLLGWGLILPLSPLLATQLGADDLHWHGWQFSVVGLFMAVFSFMQFLFSPVWGRLSDRVGRRPVLIFGLAGSTFFNGLFGYALSIGSLPLLFLSRIGAGTAGATIGTAQAYIADSTSAEKRTAGLAIIGAAFGIGFVFGPVLGGVGLKIERSWFEGDSMSGLPGYLAAGCSAIAFLIALLVLPESLKQDSKPNSRGWFNVAEWKRAASIPGLVHLVGVFFLATFAFALFEATVARLAEGVFSFKNDNVYLLFAFFGVILVFAQGALRSLSKRVTNAALARIGTILLIAGMLGTAVAVESHNLLSLYVLSVLVIVGSAFLSTTTQSMISLLSRSDEQGGVLGANQSASSMARILGPLAGNYLFEFRAFAPYLVSGCMMFLVLFLFPRQIPKTRV